MTPAEALSLESPGLGSGKQGPPAFELKFLLGEEQARVLESWATDRLTRDPHGDPALGYAYRIASLYCDTALFDVFHRAKGFKRRKFRLRRYGLEPTIYLERKSRWGERVKKKRCVVPASDLALLDHQEPSPEWAGHWFHQRVRVRGLRPACLMRYQRTAFVGLSPEGPMRVTLDRDIRGTLVEDWDLPEIEGGTPMLRGQVVCEFKFHVALPPQFKEAVTDLRLSPGSVSKYRTCMQACAGLSLRRNGDV